MWTCPRCARKNEDDAAYCARCGIEIATVQPVTSAEDAVPCYRHPKERTVLRCGKCDRPICHKCVVMSPAGTRCRECSRGANTFRLGGVLRELRIAIGSFFRSGPIGYIVVFMLFSLLFGVFRSCIMMANQPRYPERMERSSDTVPVEP